VDVRLIPEAVLDYESLDESPRGMVKQKIDELEKNPFLGEALEDKHGMDLRGYYKIYVAQKTLRIVYRIFNDTIEIWGIGKRQNFEIYENLWKRIKDRN
jgi:mRNA interferase RelE/StbE